MAALAVIVLLFTLIPILISCQKWRKFRRVKPISVNYHFTRKCNKTCVFCFHTEKTSHVASEAEMKHGLRLLKDAGMKKINFAGGEPFLYPSKLAMLCRYCKTELGLESVSIISNGTKITRSWLETNAAHIDVLGISCDSFDETTNVRIGRGSGDTAALVFRVRGWCRELGIKFKLNTVVLRWNCGEDMAGAVARLAPFRWKVFQVLPVGGENDASAAAAAADARKRRVRDLLIDDAEFAAFCARHAHLPCFVPESNALMASSYVILDEYLRFLDKGAGDERASASILDVGVHAALAQVHWDQAAFRARGAVYEWSKDLPVAAGGGCSDDMPKELEW